MEENDQQNFFSKYFPRLAQLIEDNQQAETKTLDNFSTIVIPLVNDLDITQNIKVTPLSLPQWISSNLEYVYDHIFALVGQFDGTSGFILFDRTMEFIINSQHVLRRLKSFTFLSFNTDDVNVKYLIRSSCEMLNSTSERYFGSTVQKFEVQGIPAVYNGVKDRLVVSFVRTSSNLDQTQLMVDRFPFSTNKNNEQCLRRYEVIRDNDADGHSLDDECLYKVFDQVKLSKGQTIFDIGIGSLKLALHGAHITGEDVHGNDISVPLFEQLEKFWPPKTMEGKGVEEWVGREEEEGRR
jgi:hypothetical protein